MEQEVKRARAVLLYDSRNWVWCKYEPLKECWLLLEGEEILYYDNHWGTKKMNETQEKDQAICCTDLWLSNFYDETFMSHI